MFGVEEKKVNNKTVFEIVGVYDVNGLQKYITDICSTSFEPIIRPNIAIFTFDDKTVLSLTIDNLSARYKPCYYKPKGLHNGSFIRVGDRDDHMTEYEIYKFLSYKDNISDDLRPVIGSTIDDLDQDMLDVFIEKYTIDKPNFSKFSKLEILINAGILTKVEDKVFPTVAGIMVFGLYPQKYFPQWFVAAISVPGFEIGNLGELGERFIDNKRIEGNIETMYQETIKFLNRNMKVGMRLNHKTGLREDLPEYPIEALREAISNMLIHRDLSQYKESVYNKVTVFKNKIEFRNVGNLYGDNTIEKLKDPEMIVEVRNKTIVKLIEIMGGVIENRHTGIKTMEEVMKKNNLPTPVFKNEREDFVVTFYNGEYPMLSSSQNKKTQDRDQDRDQDKKTKFDEIVDYCLTPKSLIEIINKLGYQNKTKFKNKYINPLIESGKLSMTFPDKPTSRNQKYVSTNTKIK